MNWCFTLRSFAQMYADTYGAKRRLPPPPNFLTSVTGKLDVNSFSERLWGDIYFNNDTRKFTRKQGDPDTNRTFVHFILEPLYKLYSNVLSEETETLKETLHGLGIQLKPVMYKMDVRPLLKAVLDQFFGPSTGLVDVIVDNIPSPIDGAAVKVCYLPDHFGRLFIPILDRRNLLWASNV